MSWCWWLNEMLTLTHIFWTPFSRERGPGPALYVGSVSPYWPRGVFCWANISDLDVKILRAESRRQIDERTRGLGQQAVNSRNSLAWFRSFRWGRSMFALTRIVGLQKRPGEEGEDMLVFFKIRLDSTWLTVILVYLTNTPCLFFKGKRLKSTQRTSYNNTISSGSEMSIMSLLTRSSDPKSDELGFKSDFLSPPPPPILPSNLLANTLPSKKSFRSVQNEVAKKLTARGANRDAAINQRMLLHKEIQTGNLIGQSFKIWLCDNLHTCSLVK